MRLVARPASLEPASGATGTRERARRNGTSGRGHFNLKKVLKANCATPFTLDMGDAQIISMSELHSRYRGTVMLAVLVGDFKPAQALRLAGEVWDKFPALFPDFAADLLECGARSACWSLAQTVTHTPGAWDVWVEACKIARL